MGFTRGQTLGACGVRSVAASRYAELHEPLSTKFSPRWILRCFFRFFSLSLLLFLSLMIMYVTTQIMMNIISLHQHRPPMRNPDFFSSSKPIFLQRISTLNCIYLHTLQFTGKEWRSSVVTCVVQRGRFLAFRSFLLLSSSTCLTISMVKSQSKARPSSRRTALVSLS